MRIVVDKKHSLIMRAVDIGQQYEMD